MRIAISSGHSLHVRGARGVLDEVDENRRVVNAVTDLLQASNIKVARFHDDSSRSVSANLGAIVGWHNRQQRDLDVSVHFNAHQTTSRPMGTECLHRSQANLAGRVSTAMATAGKFIDRGAKHRTNLSFLNNTARPAILLEVCFVDSSHDAQLYRPSFENICRAIAIAISSQNVGGGGGGTGAMPVLRMGSRGEPVRELQNLLRGLTVDGIFGPATEARVREFQRAQGIVADGVVGPVTWGRLLQ